MARSVKEKAAPALQARRLIFDIFAQMSSFNALWFRVRWVVPGVETVFAAVITRFVPMGMFANAT